MSKNSKNKADIFSYRMNEIRHKKISKLRALDLFNSTSNLSRIFDYLIDFAIENPERLESSILSTETDILSIVKKLSKVEDEYNQEIINILEMLDNKITALDNKFDLVLDKQSNANLEFGKDIKTKAKRKSRIEKGG